MTNRNGITFEVYTYFGRIISRHKVGETETHHRASEEARLACAAYSGNSWVRMSRT